ncbi:MAG TPA: DUF1598 domain-containing protein [Pirellulales bacterium]
MSHWIRRLGSAALVAGLTLLCGVNTAHAQRGSFAGVHVDADHVLRVQTVADPDGQLLHDRIAAAKHGLKGDVVKASPLRKISLNRLEAEVTAAIKEGRDLPPEVRCLAGLQRIQYVFLFPASGDQPGDVVFAGPAEGWFVDPVGMVRGMESGKPTLLLEDLVAALRMFPAGQKSNPLIGCSIDPTQEGLARLQSFLRQVGANATPDQTQFIVNGLRNSLGLQTVTVMGVPGDTHFAQVMVEADYRMKLMGIGLERPAVKLASYVDMVNPSAVSRNALQRWYFTPNYECVKVSEDKTAMELVGLGVKLVGEDELVAQDGNRSGTGKQSNAASAKWTAGFTKAYPDLAAKTPIYAQLRNLIDLSVAAAYLQQHDYYGKAGWEPLVFADEKLFEIQTHNVPEKVESAINSIWKENVLMTPIGGGVEIAARKALKTENLIEDADGSVQAAREKVEVKLQAGQWWWD